jgi:predicted  nucleic acid-binding Zn-ribbon protein
MSKELSTEDVEDLQERFKRSREDVVRCEERINSYKEQKKRIVTELEKAGVECDEDKIEDELKKIDKKMLEEKEKIEEIFDKMEKEKVAVT